jgi:ATP-dependent DNA helicase RecG
VTAATDPFEQARLAIEQPLRFVCRGGLTHLERVRGLAATLFAAAGRARALAGTKYRRGLVDELLAAVPADELAAEERLSRLEQCLALVTRLAEPAPPDAGALDAPLQSLKGVGPRLAELLSARALHSVRDLLFFLPRRYEDRRAAGALGELTVGQHAVFEAVIRNVNYRGFGGRRTLEVVVGDDTAVVHLSWFRVPGRGFAERFVPGERLRASGVVKEYRGRLQIVHPEVSSAKAAGDTVAGDTGDALVPVYLEVAGVAGPRLRRIVAGALPFAAELAEPLPARLLHERGLPPLGEAVAALHAPPAGSSQAELCSMRTPWQRRLIYEELLLLQLAVLRRKAVAQRQRGLAIPLASSLVEGAAALLPFPLTGAQERALADIDVDLRRALPMLRLVQGDVGSGKTAVALVAAAAVARAGMQAAIMAPTEILVEQHRRVAQRTLAKAGLRVAALTSAVAAGERRRILEELAAGTIQVIVGTQALIQERVRFRALGLAIVDEQHRFGVMQRATLVAQGRATLGVAPHMLVMTATPIPRTLALTAYGDLDLTLIDELPPGRTPVLTQLFRDTERAQVYARIRRAVESGRQAYIVFPLVETSEGEGMESVRAATSAAAELAAGPLAGLRLALLHGRLAAADKERIMQSFGRGEIDVLVATTVIEVGIDVANATVMAIEHAEHFGLSQLHQLRGRVGRGRHTSECLLVATCRPGEEAWQRLRVLEECSDGFRIAEEDLRLRGPGDVAGTRQSGLPLLAVADLARDQGLLLLAREDAAALLARDPDLAAEENRALALALRQFAEGGTTLAQSG